MSRLEEIQVFVALVESQSSTRAADKLGLATSAVSRRMKALEQRLGVQLVQRTTRRMKLTPDGQAYFLRCRKLLDDWEEADQEVMQSAAELSGRLSISAPLSLGLTHLSDAITDFMCLHPGLEVNLDLSDRRVDIIEEGYDLVLRIGDLEDSTMIARRLARIRHCVHCSGDFLNRYGFKRASDIQTPDDLKPLPGLVYSNLRRPVYWRYTTPEGVKEIKVTPKMTSSNGEALVAAAVKGLGVGCQPFFIIEQALKRGDLTLLLQEYEWYGMGLYALYPHTRHLSRKIRVLVDFLIDYFVRNPSWNEMPA